MRSAVILPAAAFLSAALITGCLPSEPEAPAGTSKNEAGSAGQSNQDSAEVQATPGQLVDLLITMASDPEDNSQSTDRYTVAYALANMGPRTLVPLIEYIGDPAVPERQRLFILQVVFPHLTPAYLDAIQALVESEDESVRIMGVAALGHIRSDEAVRILEPLKDDERPRIRLAALSELVMNEDTEAREQLRSLYWEPARLDPIPADRVRLEIVRVLVGDPTEADLPVLVDAMDDAYLATTHRAAIAQTLGRMGNASHVAVLEESLALEELDEYATIVEEAVSAIEERADA